MKPLSAFTLVLLAAGSGCSSYTQVRSVAELPPGNRVLIGRLRVVGSPTSEWVPGAYLDTEASLTDKVPLKEGKFAPNAFSGDDLSNGFSGLTKNGGTFRINAHPKPVYFLGLRVSSTIFLATYTTLFPALIRVPSAPGQCQYFGTIEIGLDDGHTSYAVVDEFDADAAVLAQEVRGCIPVKNLAVALYDVDAELRDAQR